MAALFAAPKAEAKLRQVKGTTTNLETKAIKLLRYGNYELGEIQISTKSPESWIGARRSAASMQRFCAG